jgi:acyl carrier protein
MGLDSVEIVLEVENAFGIAIPDKEAEKVLTVGDFHNLVWNYVKDRRDVHCKSQNVFYRIRTALSEITSIDTKQIGTDVYLADLIPIDKRREVWTSLSEGTALKLPDLVLLRPYSTIVPLVLVSFMLSVVIATFILIFVHGYSEWILLLPILCFFFTVYISTLLEPKKKIIKQRTLRDFTETVVAINYKSGSNVGETSREEVEEVINKIIIDKSGVEPEEVTPEKKLHDDLGID